MEKETLDEQEIKELVEYGRILSAEERIENAKTSLDNLVAEDNMPVSYEQAAPIEQAVIAETPKTEDNENNEA